LKIHILHDIQEGPYGGGNQFLKSLREHLRRDDAYEERARRADVILLNSHQNLAGALALKAADARKSFVHRVDGPVSEIRDSHRRIDDTIYRINEVLADGTVFQSEWSQRRNRSLGMPGNRFETVVLNAPDPEIFHPRGKRPFDPGRKTRIVAASWSSHPNKGFDAYQWLDDHLDFTRYEMTFIGRTPVPFRNIHVIEPLPSPELAGRLRDHDVFVTASRRDPCSNALIEALHCGLPAVALNDGGHPEIVGRGGELFDRREEIPERLERIRARYEVFCEGIRLPGMSEVAGAYRSFMGRVHRARVEGVYKGKRLLPRRWAREQAALARWAILRKAEGLGDRFRRRGPS